MKRNLVIIALSIALLGVSWLALRPLFKGRQDPGILALQEVRRIKELHLVNFMYEDMFFYHSRQDKGKRVVFIVHVPLAINAFIDLSKANLIAKDSTISIELPEISIAEPNYLVDRMRVQTVRRFTLLMGVDLHKKLLEGFSAKLADRKPLMIKAARENGIEQLAISQAEQYFQSLFRPLGYSTIEITVKNKPVASDTTSYPEPLTLPLDGIKTLE